LAADYVADNSVFLDGTPRTEDGSGALVNEMKSCRSMQDIVEVIQDEAVDMTAPEVALAIYRLGYLSKDASRQGTIAKGMYYVFPHICRWLPCALE
jgi:hypothetical protein